MGYLVRAEEVVIYRYDNNQSESSNPDAKQTDAEPEAPAETTSELVEDSEDEQEITQDDTNQLAEENDDKAPVQISLAGPSKSTKDS